MELIKEEKGWKLYKNDNARDYTVETPEGFTRFYSYKTEYTFYDDIKRGWIWIDKECYTGMIENSKIIITKNKKQFQSDKSDLFLKNYNTNKEELVEKLKPILVKADEKFEICKAAFFKSQEELDFDVDYTMLGDTYGIYKDYMYISFKIDGVFCRFELN
jgi:hypothetical protein